jgi:hypothetical protein
VGFIAQVGETYLADKTNKNNEVCYISPDSIELNCIQIYSGNRTKSAGKFMVYIQQIPEDPEADDPVVLRFHRNDAPYISFSGKSVLLGYEQYYFLLSLAEHPREVVRYLDIYEAVYSHWSETSDDMLYSIRTRLLKKLEKEVGDELIPEDLIKRKHGEGYILNLKKWQVEII